jgi:hypothetical protein
MNLSETVSTKAVETALVSVCVEQAPQLIVVLAQRDERLKPFQRF